MLICPVCSLPLFKENNSLCCENKHCYDIAHGGYVNLLLVQNKHSLHPGDTKQMLSARRSFLDGGFYRPLLDAVKSQAQLCLDGIENPLIADIGCGEGYYLTNLCASLNAQGVGIDISKDAVKLACSRNRQITWLVATAAKLPLKDGCADLACCVFSLFQPSEFARILKTNGCVIEVTAAEGHLREIKEIIYDTVEEKAKSPAPAEGFEEIFRSTDSFCVRLENQDLVNLLYMTPHFWRIKEERRQTLEKTPFLEVTAVYNIRVLKKL